MKKHLFAAAVLFGLCAALPLTTQAAPERYRIAGVPKGTTDEYWKSANAGMVKAQREFADQGVKVDIMWKGPIREDDREQQIQVMENFVARRVSAIVLAPLDGTALVPSVELASRAKIPVVLIDSTLDKDVYVSEASTDNYQGGVIAARRLAELLDGKGKVIVVRVVPGSTSVEARVIGFLDTIKEFPEIEVISSDQYAGPSRDTAYRTAQNLINRYGHQIDGIFTPNNSSTSGTLLALADVGRSGGKVKHVGFDTDKQSVAALRAGDLQGLIVQDPLNMGYVAVKTAIAKLRGESVPKLIDTGCTLITAENMDSPDIHDLLHPPLDKYL